MIILYNPLSKNGGSQKKAFKLVKSLNKKKIPNQLIDLLTIENINVFLKNNSHVEAFIIVGGDGTLNHLANDLTNLDFKPKLLLYSGGTGNDFARSVRNKSKLIDIKKYFYDLPEIVFNGQSKKFLNGVGMGLDGLVVNKVNNSKFKNSKFNYFRHTLEAFKQHQADSCEIIVDGDSFTYEKVWMVTVMNSKYFGGGMKIAPKANRLSKELNVVIVQRASKFKLFLLFPLIYLGWHTKMYKYISVKPGVNIEINFNNNQYMQIDGEDFKDIKTIKVNKG